MLPHRTRCAAAFAAGVLAAALSGIAGGAFAGPPTHRDPSPSPSDPAPSDPGTPPSTSPTSGPPPTPEHDMSLVGSSVKGHVGGTVRVVLMVYTAGVREYSLSLPVRSGTIRYVGRCSDTVDNTCVIDYATGDTIDTRVLEFRILQAGTTQIPVELRAKGATDPNPANNTARATVTNGTPGPPRDMAVSAGDVRGRVGELVTVDLRIRTSEVPRYHVELGLDSEVDYVGQCDSRDDGKCLIRLERRGAVDTYALKFRITQVGKVTPRVHVAPDGVPDPDDGNNTVYPVVEGLPAGGGGDDDGGSGSGSGDDDGGGLPTTGTPTAAFAVSGAVLFGTGLVLLLATRRRRRAALASTRR